MRKLLIQNATVFTMDPGSGDLRPGDILVGGDRITAVGARISAAGAESLDGGSFIVILGLVNAHMVAGEWRKRDGKLLFRDLDRLKAEIAHSGNRILAELGWRPESQQAR